MAGTKNLIPQNRRTKEEQKEIARMGGIASGKSRRAKADFRKALQNALNSTYTTDDDRKLSGTELLIESMMVIASDPNNNYAVSAFKTLLKMTGQDVPEQTSDDDDQVKAFLKALRGD